MLSAARLVWVAPEHDDGSSATAKDENTKKGNGEPAPSTILVVEDEVLPRIAVSDFLRDCGYRVLEAKNGEEAKEIMLAGELVEVLFSDIGLGSGITGLGLAKWTRTNYPSVRIMLTSGVQQMVEMSNELCDRPLVAKPYSYPTLADEIRQLLGALGRRRS